MSLLPCYSKQEILMPKLACYILILFLVVCCVLTALTLGLLPVYLRSSSTSTTVSTVTPNLKVSLKSNHSKFNKNKFKIAKIFIFKHLVQIYL